MTTSVSEVPSDAEPVVVEAGVPAARSALQRWNLTWADALVAATGLLLVVVFAPTLTFGGWTPRQAVLLAAAPAGVWCLFSRCRDRDRATILLTTALLWLIVSALLSEAPRSSLLGFAGRDVSVVTLIAATGLWALGSGVSERGHDVLVNTVIWAMNVVAFLGVVSIVARIDGGSISMSFGRARSIYPNPVYFGALCAGAAVLVMATAVMRADRRFLALAVLPAMGAMVSGSRVATGSILLLLVVQIGLSRNRRSVEAAVVLIASLSTAALLDQTRGSGRGAAARLSEGSASNGRTQIWRYALDAWTERPVIGFGPGLFRPAVQHRYSDEFVRRSATDELRTAWFDPHNALIHVLVVGGVVAVVLLAAWFVVALRPARGPALMGAAAIAVTWSLQPLNMTTVPLALMLFGAASAGRSVPVPTPRRSVGVVLAAVGTLCAGWILLADVALTRAVDSANPSQAARVAALYLDDPVASDIVAQLHQAVGDVDGTLEWRARAAGAEPDRPYWWSQLARAQVAVRDLEGAEASIARADALQPSNTRTTRARLALALARRDLEQAQVHLDRLCDLGDPLCGLEPEGLLAIEDAAAADGQG